MKKRIALFNGNQASQENIGAVAFEKIDDLWRGCEKSICIDTLSGGYIELSELGERASEKLYKLNIYGALGGRVSTNMTQNQLDMLLVFHSVELRIDDLNIVVIEYDMEENKC